MADPQVQTQDAVVVAPAATADTAAGGNVTVTTAAPVENGNVSTTAEGGNTTRDSRGDVPPSVMRRIDELATDKRTLTQKLADAEARLAALQNPPGNTTTNNARQVTDADLEYRAAQIAARREFDNTCAKVYDQGAKDFPDWQNSVGMLQRMTGQAIIPIVEAALEAGDTHKVLYELGKNPEEASKIASLPPARQAAAVVKFANSINKPAAVSKAADPITTLVGGSGNKGEERLDSDKIAMKDWVALRNKQLAGAKR